MSARPLRLKLGVSALTLLVSGLLAYAAFVRWQDQQPLYVEQLGEAGSGHRFLHHTRLGWVNVPRLKGTTYGKPLTINGQGLRDRDYTYEKPEGTQRILVLGDSFCWGYGVGDGEIFTEVLEDRLEDKLQNTDPPTSWQVLNAGVDGWGTDQEYLFLCEEGFNYSPDVVVLSFFAFDDFDENVASRRYGLEKPVFGAGFELSNVPVPRPGRGPDPYDVEADEVELTTEIVKRMAQQCERQGSRLVVMQFGSFLFTEQELEQSQPGSDERLLVERTLAFARALDGVPNLVWFDLDAQFRQLGLGYDELVAGNRDGHWNARGHGVVARLLNEFLVQEGILPS